MKHLEWYFDTKWRWSGALDAFLFFLQNEAINQHVTDTFELTKAELTSNAMNEV